MRILVVNDDGIRSEGLRRLAAAAREFGEVTVVAPAEQCSAMSHRLTISDLLRVKEEPLALSGVKAYSVSGTPADCVKIALQCLMESRPDVVFSGINNGYNTGFDILYSGTVGAAMEGLANGIPSYAFSKNLGDSYEITDRLLVPVIREVLGKTKWKDRIWNINFPGCHPDACRGVLWDRLPSQNPFYWIRYLRTDQEEGSFLLQLDSYLSEEGDPGSDIAALMEGYISIGTVCSTAVRG